MKFSVITPVFNNEMMIRSCMESVAIQDHPDKEHIIVDGLSMDNTVREIEQYAQPFTRLISERDNGLYDAINKGIASAEGDIVCFLCSDDLYAHGQVLSKIAKTFEAFPEAAIVYSDIVYVDRDDVHKVDRYWKSSPFKPGLYRKGWLPPNTSFFVRRKYLMQYGMFNTNYKYAADYDLNYRLLEIHKLPSLYVPQIMVKMRSGGISNASLKGIYKSLKDCHDVLRSHRVRNTSLYIINTLFYRLRQEFIPWKVREAVRHEFK